MTRKEGKHMKTYNAPSVEIFLYSADVITESEEDWTELDDTPPGE